MEVRWVKDEFSKQNQMIEALISILMDRYLFMIRVLVGQTNWTTFLKTARTLMKIGWRLETFGQNIQKLFFNTPQD